VNKEMYIASLRNEIIKIGNYAVKKAQEESLKKGIPNVYSLNNVIFYQLPDGMITMETPEQYRKKAFYPIFVKNSLK